MENLPPELITYELLPHFTGNDLQILRTVNNQLHHLVGPVVRKRNQLISRIIIKGSPDLRQITTPQKIKQIDKVFKIAVKRALRRDLPFEFANYHFDGLKVVGTLFTDSGDNDLYLIGTSDNSDGKFEVHPQWWNRYQRLIPLQNWKRDVNHWIY